MQIENNNNGVKYKINIDLHNKNSSHYKIYNFVNKNDIVLDVGCACGDLGYILYTYKNCTLYGLEFNKQSIEIAQNLNVYKNIWQCDLNYFNVENFINKYSYFDCIICGDILEHLYNPLEALTKLLKLLKTDGYIIISIPNIGHSSIKAQLLDDHFIYTETGLLDNTHIRFFTKNTLPYFFSKLNLQIDNCDFVTAPFNGNYSPELYKNISIFSLIRINKNKFSHIFQYVLKCSNSKLMYEKLLSNNEDKLNNIIIKKEIFKKSFINLIELKFELIYKFLININKFFKSLKNEGLYLTLKKIYYHLRLTNPTPKHIQIATPIYESKKQIYCKQNNIKLICFYLPQFHTFPENDLWWGKGFTEWTNVNRSKPMFANHIQPEVPHSDIGYYIIKDSSIIKKQMELAHNFGIYGFCFHYYWFSGKKLMNKVIENFLEDKSIDFPFCINWANENWTRRWDGREDQVLIKQEYSLENLQNFILEILPIFKDKRYIRINNRPVFLIYRADQIPNIKSIINLWKNLCNQNKEEDPFFVMCLADKNYEFKGLGFDAAVQFPPHMPWTIYRPDLPSVSRCTVDGLNKNFKGSIISYDDALRSCITSLDHLIFPGLFPSWDNTPRRLEYSTIFAGSSPKKYANWLEQACKYASHQEHKFIFINAWNEWGEGAHLEPDNAWGYAWLNETARIISQFNN